MENENKIYCKFRYKCGICGAEHDSILERAKCEIACARKGKTHRLRCRVSVGFDALLCRKFTF